MKFNPVWVWASLSFILLAFLALPAQLSSPTFAWSQLAAVVPPPAPPAFTAVLPPPAPPILASEAWLTAYVSSDLRGGVEILAEKEAGHARPLASLTKLMTALVASDSLKLDSAFTFLPEDLIPEDSGFYRAGETFLAGDLLDSLLVESSNSAAVLLARATAPGETLASDDFVARLNRRAAALGLAETSFVNPNGLDPAAGGAVNTSTARDLLQLAIYLLKNHPHLLAITRESGLAIYESSGLFHHQAQTTNALLAGALAYLPAEIVGGKTGQTERAGRNLLLVLKDKATGGYVVSVVLGSPNHFADTAALLDWVYRAYRFG